MSTNSSQSSFIPKRRATHANLNVPAKRVFVFSLVAYSLVFALLLASGASYLYKNYTTSLLQKEVALLNSEVDTFSVGDLSVVSEFDLTLQRANNRLNSSVSIAATLEAIDQITAQPVQIRSLTMERFGDDYMILEAKVIAQSFDSALFQRKLVNADPQLFSQVVIDDIFLAPTAETEDQPAVVSLTNQTVYFTVTMRLPIESVPYGSTQANRVRELGIASNQTAP